MSGDTCHNGHPRTPDNLSPRGKCRACGRMYVARSSAKKRGFVSPDSQEAKDQRRLAAVTAGIRDGLTRPEIAAQLGISRSALNQWVRRRGLALPRARPVEPEPVPVGPAETRTIGDHGWVRCGIHGDVPRTGPLRLTVPHNQGRLARIAELHAHCHETHD